MRTQSVEVAPSETNHKLADLLQCHFPWIDSWDIKGSYGMSNVVGGLLNEIESILGLNPTFYFFRITQDPISEEVFQSQICVFYSAKTRNLAKKKALNHAINSAIQMSKAVCKQCGHRLENRNVKDEEELRRHPFLALLDKDHYRSTHVVCMPCCEQMWQNIQAEFDDRTDLDPVANVFSGIETPVKTEGDVENHPTASIYKSADIDKLEKDYKEGNREQVNRVKRLIQKIREGSPEKKLVTIPQNWRHLCDDLSLKFPNFAEVIIHLRNNFALSAMTSESTFRLAPTLLCGSPGCGKSEFLLTVADALSTHLEILNICNSQTGSSLTGSESFWGNSQPSRLFEILVHGDTANPIFLLEEIDKARSDGTYSPLAALHQLLEPRQARRYADLSVPELQIDASHVVWLASANRLDLIERPIIDRFTIFEIPDPSQYQMAAIAKNQYQRFIETNPAGKYFEGIPDDDVISELSQHHPRSVRKILEGCFGRAAYNQRIFLNVDDVRVSSPKIDSGKHGIGFLAPI